MIPATIIAQMNFLKTQIVQFTPLVNTPRSNVVAMQLNAANLVSSVQAALTAPNNMLDTWTAPTDPVAIAAGITAITQAAIDQANLSLLRGVVGRVASNLNQVA